MVAHGGHNCAGPCAVAHVRTYGDPHEAHRPLVAADVGWAGSGIIVTVHEGNQCVVVGQRSAVSGENPVGEHGHLLAQLDRFEHLHLDAELEQLASSVWH